MNNDSEQNNQLEEKTRRKGHGPVYWIIVVVGVAFIVAASFNIGVKVGKMVEGNDITTTSNSNELSNKDNSNITSNADSNVTSNVESNVNSNISKLSNEEALNIGNDLYKKAKTSYADKMNQESCSDSSNIDGEMLTDCTSLYNNLLNYFSTNNQVSRGGSPKENIFSSFINKNSKYYLVPSGGGFNGEAKTTLTISSLEENKIIFTAKSVISLPNEQGQLEVDSTETDDFIIVKENNTWKISYFVTRGI